MAVDEALLLNHRTSIIVTTLDAEELSMLEGPYAPAEAEGAEVRDGHGHGHGREKRYRCEKCDKAYFHSQSLVRHRGVECGKQPQNKCPHCPYMSKQKTDLKKHIRRKHSVGAADDDSQTS